MTPRNQALSRLAAVGDGTGRDPACLLPSVMNVNGTDSPSDVLDALALAAYATGAEPHARTTHLDEVRPEASLLPPGVTVLRSAGDSIHEACLAVGDGWTIRTVRWRSGGASVTVTAATEELARAIMEAAIDGAVPQRRRDDSTVTMGFWHRTSRHGSHRSARRVTAAAWPDIRANYPAAAAAAISALMSVDADSVTGRLVLLHGAPGTGKTTLLRALARAWEGWCQADCVLDPETLFADPGYLMEVVIGREHERSAPAWRLLILEDCDELIRSEAKHSAGQALSRLLNLTDGILGQGRNVLVSITTNEDLYRLHPAVVRPGRCLAQIEIGALTAAEASTWLGRRTGPATLAELYALRDGSGPAQGVAPSGRPTGQYL